MAKKKQEKKPEKPDEKTDTMRNVRKWTGFVGIGCILIATILSYLSIIFIVVGGLAIYVGLTNNFEIKFVRKEKGKAEK